MGLKPSNTESTARETKLLRRWSRTKLENCVADGTHKNIPSKNRDKVVKSDVCSGEGPEVDRDFGKILSPLALKKLFRKPEFSVLDGLNEYDDDCTYFAPRGELITQEMRRVTGELGDRIANADMKAEGKLAGLHDEQSNSAFPSSHNAESPEDEEAGGKA